ncbi:hypothetical protein [Oscillatoria acuminata]|uniref:Uncharacterized protein n=1 Tax=Oscillatoria acuminata PCC 6304 TaxID=56110 RepID=K9TIW3_9CYAN|nr:hypothetical protein [Oscillatoria acuminata]AFY82106.1 hypothetical protein Oscil6304_2487 [Oscillatoria acuminata PCC 6304]
MNLKTPGSLLIFGMAIAAGCLGLPWRATGEATAIVGNCAEFDCSELLNELQESFPEAIAEAKSQCSEPQFIGMNLWEQNESRRVSLFCWNGERDNTAGYREGVSLGLFPVPGEEDSFGSSWGCFDSRCEEQVNALQETYPEEMRNHEIQCGLVGGDLNLLVSESEQKIDIQCVFSAGVIFVDIDDDGVSDGENSRGTFVDNILGAFPLP